MDLETAWLWARYISDYDKISRNLSFTQYDLLIYMISSISRARFLDKIHKD